MNCCTFFQINHLLGYCGEAASQGLAKKRHDALAARDACLTGPAWVGAQRNRGSAWPTVGPVNRLARLDELQTLTSKTPLLGVEFVQLINSQIDTWASAAKFGNVGVIT